RVSRLLSSYSPPPPPLCSSSPRLGGGPPPPAISAMLRRPALPEIPPTSRLAQRTGIGIMVVNTKRAFYVRYLAHQSYLDTIAKRPDIRLDRLENDSAAAAVEPMIAPAPPSQIASSPYEIPPHSPATADLLARIPNLLIVSTNGAGYDTVDVKACTAAGVLVLNQAGGNREAVAEHA